MSKSTTLVALFLLGRYLGDEAFGRYAVALAIPVALESLGDLGTSQTLIRDGAGRPARVRGDAVALVPAKLVLASLIVLASILASRLLGLPDEIAEMILWLAVAKALDSFTILSRSVFEAFERMDFEAASLVLDGVVRLALVVAALLSGFGLVGLAKAIALSSLVVLVATAAVTLHRFVGLRSWSFAPSRSLAIVGAGLPLATVWLFEGLSFRLDTVVVERYLGDQAAGLFSAAVRLVEPLLIVPMVMAMTILPVLSRHLAEQQDTLARLFRAGLQLALVGALLQAAILVGLADQVTTAAFGPDFDEAGRIIRVLALALFPLVTRVMLVNAMTALRAQRQLVAVQFAGTLTNLVLALVLVRAIGANGAVAAIVLGESVTVALGWWTMRRSIPLPFADLARTAAVGVAALAALVLAKPFGPYAATALALAVILGGVRVLRVVHEDEQRYLVHSLPRLAWLMCVLLGPLPARRS